MKQKHQAVVIAAGVLLSAVPLLVAQDANTNPNKPAEKSSPPSNKDPYAVSLGTGELISLSGEPRIPATGSEQQRAGDEYADGLPLAATGKAVGGELFYGLSAATVYREGSPALVTGEAFSTTVSPFVALLEPTRTGSYLLQYSAVIAPDEVGDQGPQFFHTGAIAVVGALSRRLTWSFSSAGSYGSQSARLQGPLAYSVVQSTPVVSTGSVAVLLPSGNAVLLDTSVGLSWRKSSREALGLSVIHTYSGVAAEPSIAGSVGSHSNMLGVKASYDRAISSRYTFLGYGEANTMLRIPPCQTYGGGVGLSIQVSPSVGVSLAGGPQFSSKACGRARSASFSASVAVNLSRRDRIYASAARRFSTAYLSTGTWEDTVGAGFARDMRRLRFTTDAGWLRAEQTPPSPTYYGYFVAPRVSLRLTESLSVTAAYRNLHGSGGRLGSGAVSLASVSLDWHPPGKHLK